LAQTESQKDLNEALVTARSDSDSLLQQLEELRSEKASLKEEISAVEKQAFKNFCKKAKVKTVADFEA